MNIVYEYDYLMDLNHYQYDTLWKSVINVMFAFYYIPALETRGYLHFFFLWDKNVTPIILHNSFLRVENNKIAENIEEIEHFWPKFVRCPLSLSSCCCCKLFTFSSSSPEPLGQFQPNLAQSILRWNGFKFVQMKDSPFFEGRQWWNSKNTLTNFKNLLFEPLHQFQPNLAQIILGWR